MLGIDEERVNVNGGAVALGHPIGASGARIIGALVLELRRRGGGYGCAAICSGGGQGDAIIVQVLTERPHILPPPPGGGRDQARGRARRRVLRPRPHADRGLLVVPVRPRGLQGGDAHRAATSPATPTRTSSSACGARPTRAPTRSASASAKMLEGAKVRDLQRLSGARAGRRAAAPVPAHARARLRAPGRRPPDLHLHRRRAGDGRADGDRADLRRRGRLAWPRSIDGVYTGREGGPFNYREGKAQAIRELAEREGIDLAASYAYRDSRVRPADAAARRASCGGQSGQGTGARGARGGVGDHAVRASRAASCASPRRRRC